MGKKKPESLDVSAEQLAHYSAAELHTLREKLIEDIARIEGESKQADQRIKAFNVRKNELNAERAARSRSIRAVKHALSQRRDVVEPPKKKAEKRASR